MIRSTSAPTLSTRPRSVKTVGGLISPLGGLISPLGGLGKKSRLPHLRLGGLMVLFSLMLLAGTARAQSLIVSEGNVSYAYPYDPATTMTYGTNTLTINGEDYDLSALTSITGVADQTLPASVFVHYSGASATVCISGDLRGRVSASISGANVTLTDEQESIDDPDIAEVTYHLSGTSTDGSFHQVGAYKCSISLEGISLESSACPFEIENGKRIGILLADGTQNTFRDGANNLRKSCFWVKGHAEFTGAGTLNLTGTQRHAYSSNEYTQLKSSFTGNINILGAQSDGMNIDQYFEQRGGNVAFRNVVGDCLDVSATTDPADELNGQIIISGGTLDCTASGDDTKCLKSESHTTISGGNLTLRCTGDGSKGLSVGTTVNEVGSGDLTVEQDPTAASNARPYIYILATGDEYVNPLDETDTSKCRGIKVKGNFTFNGGTIERDLSSTVKSSKVISVDGTYTYKTGAYKNCSFSK